MDVDDHDNCQNNITHHPHTHHTPCNGQVRLKGVRIQSICAEYAKITKLKEQQNSTLPLKTALNQQQTLMMYMYAHTCIYIG